jgi:PAS domain S-box-containing protein
MIKTDGKNISNSFFSLLPGVIILSLLFIVSRYNYLIFHTLAEFFSIIIAWGLFIIVWNTKETVKNDALVFIGIAYLFIGGLDLFHTLSYKGMGVLDPERGANPATQLWIIARYMESITLCMFPFLLGKRIKVAIPIGVYSIASAIALFLIFIWDLFPTCYIEGVGLTIFKKNSEYIICILLMAAFFFLYKKKNLLDQTVYNLLAVSIVLTIIAELAFTFYVSVYGLSNLIGHFLKIISFYLIYKAFIHTGLKKPYRLMFKEISDKEKRYRQMFETNLAVKLIINPADGSIVEANNAACHFYGYTKNAFLSLKISDINALPPTKVTEEMNRAKSEKELFFKFPHRLASGEIRDVEVYSGPIKYGQDTFLYSIIHDVTKQKQAEEAINRNEAMQSKMFANIGDVIVIVDQHGINRYKSTNIEKIFGWKPEDVIGVSTWENIHPDDLESTQKFFGKLMNVPDSVGTTECRYRRKDGSYSWIEFTGTNLLHDPDINGLLGNYHDINERKQTEEALKESETRLKKAQSVAKIGNWEYDIATGTVWASEQAFQIYGLERTSPYLPLDKVEACIPDVQRVNKALVDLIQKNKKYDIEFEVHRKSDRKATLIHSLAEVVFNNEVPIKILGVIHDITEQRKFEYQLQQSQKMESIGTLAGGIAHDFNNILFPIVGHTEMLLEDVPEDSPVREGLNQIYTGAMRASELVKQILTFSRQENSELTLMKMQPIIKEALKLIRSTIPTTIEIKQNIDPKCGVIKADPTQIHQIIMNLSTNAYHAMEETGGELIISLKEIKLNHYDTIRFDIIPGDYACLTIADTGKGMDKKLIQKIFEPFFTTKEKGKGTGMGLSVAHGIVKSMGGAIKVDSESRKGTKFHVYLPVEKSFSEKQVIDSKVEIQRGMEQILLVDDEEAILTMEKMMLERLGYQVTSRTSSIEALEAFRDSPDKFDLVITDMAMPNMSGDKLSVELTKIRPDIPVLLCTGFSETMSEEKAASVGIKSFLLKPIVMKDLAQNIREVLDK